jgi:hypothetical protein
MRTAHGRDTLLDSRTVENPHCELSPHSEGADYWRLLPSWKETLPESKITQIATTVIDNEHDPMETTRVSRAVLEEELLKQDNTPHPMDVTQPARTVRKGAGKPDEDDKTPPRRLAL